MFTWEVLTEEDAKFKMVLCHKCDNTFPLMHPANVELTDSMVQAVHQC